MNIIPVTSDPSQAFSITILEVSYNISLRFNSRGNFWVLDISGGGFTANGLPLALGGDLLVGTAFPIRLALARTDSKNIDATAENLGEIVLLIQTTENEVATIQ